MHMENKSEKRGDYYSDLAIEQDGFIKSKGDALGVICSRKKPDNLNAEITSVRITNEQGAKTMNKPMGTYVTIEKCQDIFHDPVCKRRIARILYKIVEGMLPDGCESILVVGLGNEKMTSDSLGPETILRMFATTHLKKEGRDVKIGLAPFCPGVYGQTGIETMDFVKAIADTVKPDLIIVIDSLAAKDLNRLGSTIQISDVGIVPGSGVANHRKALNKETLKIPVVSIGVPMVIQTFVIAKTVFEGMLDVMHEISHQRRLSDFIMSMEENERTGIIRELLPDNLSDLYVSTHDCDEVVRVFSEVIADALMMISIPKYFEW